LVYLYHCAFPSFVADHRAKLDLEWQFEWYLVQVWSTSTIDHRVHNSCTRLNHADHLIARIIYKDVTLCINRYQLWPIQFILSVGSVFMTWIAAYACESCHISLLDTDTPYAVVICVSDVGDSRLSILRVVPLIIVGSHGDVFDSLVIQNIF
jgi:hypothetical protein